LKQLTILLLSFFFLTANAQKSTDLQLNSRLQEYFAYSKNLDFNKLMDYMHPRLFAVAPKEQLIQSMEQAFNNPEMKFSFDSMAVVAISPVYKFGKASYRKIDYHMGMTITLSDSIDLKNKDMAAIMLKSFQAGFPKKKIVVDASSNAIRVEGKELLFAIRDAESPEWMFLGYDRSNQKLLQQLYPRQVRQYFKVL
jgi:hypothetical protein